MIERKRSKINCSICDNCGKKEARIVHVSKSYGRGENLLVIENVPVVSCPNCGKGYLTAENLHKIENIKRNREKLAVERLVPVAVFA